MTQAWTNNDLAAMAKVKEAMGSDPGIAQALLKLLQAAGNNPEEINEIRLAGVPALKRARDTLPHSETPLKKPAVAARSFRKYEEDND